MCGILAVRVDWLLATHGELDGPVGRALGVMRARGPDGTRWVRHGNWVLGCARLAVSEPRSTQPLVLRGRRWAVAFNGAVTNARDVWASMRPRLGARKRLPNDAWLPLLVAASGSPAARFHGHGCALVVDAQEDVVHVYADPLGEKPLFRGFDGKATVAIASTPAALRALGIDEPADAWRGSTYWTRGSGPVAGHPTQVMVPWDRTHGWATVSGGRVEARPLVAAPVAATTAPLRELVVGAVSRCARADVRVGLCLSGGLDSSVLAAALGQQGTALDAFQFRAAGAPEAERVRAREVAARFGHRLHEVDGDEALLGCLPLLTRTWGRPLGDPSVLALHAVARAAASHGVRVLLSGEGADECFLGYRRHRALAQLQTWARFARLAAPLVGAWGTGTVARWLRAAGAADPHGSLLEVVPPAFCRLVLQHGWEPESCPVPVDIEFTARRECAEYLREDLLVKLDVGAMAAGVEGRCPFLDRDVVAWAGAQPARTLLGKAPLRAAFAGVLPRSVLGSRKQGMALPLDRWFRECPEALDLLRDRRTLARPHLRPEGVTRAVDLHRSARADLGHGLYLLLAFEHHLRAREEALLPCA